MWVSEIRPMRMDVRYRASSLGDNAPGHLQRILRVTGKDTFVLERFRGNKPLSGGQKASLVIGGAWLIGIGITLVNRYIT